MMMMMMTVMMNFWKCTIIMWTFSSSPLSPPHPPFNATTSTFQIDQSFQYFIDEKNSPWFMAFLRFRKKDTNCKASSWKQTRNSHFEESLLTFVLVKLMQRHVLLKIIKSRVVTNGFYETDSLEMMLCLCIQD